VSIKGRPKRKPPDAIDKQVGSMIRTQRLALGMSQTELAEKIGVRFRQLEKYETGINRIGASQLLRIAKGLGVDPSFLFSSNQSEAGEPEILNLIHTVGAAKLLRAFAAIKNDDVRKSIVALTQSLSDL
jgi:transcriptional regulator with XRE-family HTH domain